MRYWHPLVPLYHTEISVWDVAMFRKNPVNTSVLSRRILPTYVPLRTEQERERVFEKYSRSTDVGWIVCIQKNIDIYIII